MASLFAKIINGEIPGRFVWRDERCVAFLSVCPLKPGHTLVVPIQEIDHWIDVDAELLAHLTSVAQAIGKGIQETFKPIKIGLTVAGLEVRHCHFHVVPIHELKDLSFENEDRNPDPAALDRAAAALRETLRKQGCQNVVD
jgi:histidine triad (HIT) family protein